MARSSSDVIGSRRDELSTPQMCERRVHGAFGESGCVGNCAHTGADMAPFASSGLAIKVQINQEGGRLLIVADQITHQDVENVIVNWNGFAKSRHATTVSTLPTNEQGQQLVPEQESRSG
jgi:hypothetical protein